MLGRILGNRYEVLEKIGDGGMAYVYKAKCKLLNRIVALKVLRSEFVEDGEFLDKFKNEAQSAASLTHQNIVNIYDVGQDEDIHYIVMEYVDGKSLKDIIKSEKRLGESRALEITRQIAMALSQAHKKHIIHRDIKPHNILVRDDGVVKVVDFGIAKAVTSSTATNVGSVIGSVHYFSPEQAKGRYVDERSDLYSLGVLTYEMITGRVPFKGDTPVNIALKHINEEIEFPKSEEKEISEDVKSLILKLTMKNQSKRYLSADELIKDIDLIKNDLRPDFKQAEYEDFKTQKIENLGEAIEKSTAQREIIIEKKIAEENEYGKDYSQEEDLGDVEMNEKKGKGHKKFIMMLAVILGFVASVGFTAGGFYIKEMLKPKVYSLPSIERMDFEDAKKMLADKEIKLSIRREEYSNEIPKEHIITQDTKAGQSVKQGFEVKAVVSKGGKISKVPDFKGKKLSEISEILEENNFEEGIVKFDFSDEPEGTILSQTPKALSSLEEGSGIDFVVSKGRQIRLINVPDLVGKTPEEAKELMGGLILGETTYDEDNSQPDGVILSQSILPRGKIEENTTIDIVVNKIEQEKEIQGGEGDVKRNLSIKLPEEKQSIRVVVTETYSSYSNTVYDKTIDVQENDGLLVVPIKGVENTVKDYKITIDGEVYYEGEVSF